MVATQSNVQAVAASLSIMVTNMIAELPGNTLADKKLLANKPIKDAASISCLLRAHLPQMFSSHYTLFLNRINVHELREHKKNLAYNLHFAK